MKNQNNTVNEGFSKAWDLLPAGAQKKFREDLMVNCGWESLTTFYAKKDGKVTLRKTEKPVIQKHFELFNIDYRSGDYIKKLQE